MRLGFRGWLSACVFLCGCAVAGTPQRALRSDFAPTPVVPQMVVPKTVPKEPVCRGREHSVQKVPKDADSQVSCCGYSPSRYREWVREQRPQFAACLSRGKANAGGLTGKVIARIVLQQGVATQACDAGSDFADPDVVSCVLDVFASMKIPEIERCPQTTITYPLSFAGSRS